MEIVCERRGKMPSPHEWFHLRDSCSCGTKRALAWTRTEAGRNFEHWNKELLQPTWGRGRLEDREDDQASCSFWLSLQTMRPRSSLPSWTSPFFLRELAAVPAGCIRESGSTENGINKHTSFIKHFGTLKLVTNNLKKKKKKLERERERWVFYYNI